MLVSLLAISQGGYPRQAVIDNDTVAILSIDQIKTINKSFVALDECNELKDSLNSQITTYDMLVENYESVITSKDKEISLQKIISVEKDLIISTDEKMIKKMKRRITWLKIQRIALSAGVVILGGIHFL